MSVMVNTCLQTVKKEKKVKVQSQPSSIKKITGLLIHCSAPEVEQSFKRDNMRFCCLHCTRGKFAVVITVSSTAFVHISFLRRLYENHLLAQLQDVPAFSLAAVAARLLAPLLSAFRRELRGTFHTAAYLYNVAHCHILCNTELHLLRSL